MGTRKNVSIFGSVVLVIMFGFFTAAMSAPPKPAGELRIAVASLYGEQMDPILCSNFAKFFHLPHYDVLVGVTENGELSADRGLAYKWEPSSDFLNWTFYVRKGIKFHNGDELTAKDVKFSIERCMSAKSIDVYKPYLQSAIKSMEVVDPYKIVIHLTKPDSRFIYYLTPLMGMSGLVLPKDYITAKGDDYFVTHPVGSGPYIFVEQVLGSYIKFEAVDKHWRVGTPKFKTLVFGQVAEESTRISKLKMNEVDIIDTGRERQKELQDSGLKILRKNGARVLNLFIPDQWRPECPFSKEKVRQALNLAINREELLKYVFLGGGKVTAISPCGSWAIGYPKVKPYDYDPERAKKLLAEAGYPQGFDLEFYSYPMAGTPEGQTMVQAIAAYWSKIGLKVKIIPVDFIAYRKKLVEKTTGGAVGWSPWANRLFADDAISQIFHSKGILSVCSIPAYDELIDKTRAEVDQAKYEKLCEEIQRYAYEHYLTVPVIELDELYAANKKVDVWDLGKSIYDLNVEYLYRQK